MRTNRRRLYESLTDAELHECLLLTRLAWLRAHGHGIDQAAAEARSELHYLVAEHMIRGIDPDTGRRA